MNKVKPFPDMCKGCWGTKNSDSFTKCLMPTYYYLKTSPTRSYKIHCPCVRCLIKMTCSFTCKSRIVYGQADHQIEGRERVYINAYERFK